MRGYYPVISSNYSLNLRQLIDEMLNKDPMKRPSIKKILEKPFLANKIDKLLETFSIRRE